MSTQEQRRTAHHHDRPLSLRESALVFSAFFALALSVASLLTI